MGAKEFLFRSPAGVDHYLCQDEDGTIRTEAHQDVQHILDANGEMYNHNDGYSQSRDWKRVASIPLALINMVKIHEGWDMLSPENSDRLTKLLNDIDYLKLRTAPGRV